MNKAFPMVTLKYEMEKGGGRAEDERTETTMKTKFYKNGNAYAWLC